MKENSDYFLAGGKVGFFPLMMTFLATQVGGGVILGAAEEAYRYGWVALLYPMGAALGLMALGLWFGRKLAQFGVSTIAQIFEVVYGSKRLKKVASLLSIFSLWMILVGQIIATKQFLLSLGIDNTPLFALLWIIVILYIARGGLKAVISTDVIQALFFSAVFLAAFVIALQTHEIRFQYIEFEIDKSKWFGWLFMPLLFVLIGQDMGQRCFAGASPRIVSWSACAAGIGALIVCFVAVFFGLLAKQIGIEATQGRSVLMEVIGKTTSPLLAVLVGCAIVAAIVSTATSLINAIGSNLLNDFLPQRKGARAITCTASFAALFASFYFNTIVSVLIESYELSVSCLFVSILLAVINRRGRALSAWSSLTFGIAGFLLSRFVPFCAGELLGSCFSLAGYAFAELSFHSLKYLPKVVERMERMR